MSLDEDGLASASALVRIEVFRRSDTTELWVSRAPAGEMEMNWMESSSAAAFNESARAWVGSVELIS